MSKSKRCCSDRGRYGAVSGPVWTATKKLWERKYISNKMHKIFQIQNIISNPTQIKSRLLAKRKQIPKRKPTKSELWSSRQNTKVTGPLFFHEVKCRPSIRWSAFIRFCQRRKMEFNWNVDSVKRRLCMIELNYLKFNIKLDLLSMLQ